MLSRIFPLIRRRNDIVKCVSPVVNSQIEIFNGPEANNLYNFRNMSDVPNEVLNEPGRNLNYEQLIEKKKNKAILIDVREHSEINETGKLPDSIHIPLGELNHALGEMSLDEFQAKYKANQPQKDVSIIFSCKAGGRSRKALAQAYSLGYTKAAHYTGGWLDWVEKSKKA